MGYLSEGLVGYVYSDAAEQLNSFIFVLQNDQITDRELDCG